MRSPYDDFAVGETKRNSNNHYNNNNNNNTFNNNHNSTIPYHARENSLPFSYGQISKTSTPLRPIVTGSRTNNNNNNTYNSPGYKNGIQSDFNFDFDFGLNTEYTGGSAGDNNTTVHSVNYNVLNRNGKDVNYNYKLMAHGGELRKSENRYFCGSDSNFNHSATAAIKPNITRTTTTTTTTATSSSDEIDASRMIKTQPRLTSPLLVRKTLSNNSSRSPTRSTTNTIANTYHYSYGNNNNNSIGGGGGGGRSGSSVGDNFDKFNVNGNINQNSNNNYAYNNNNNNNTHAHYNNNSEIQRKTSTRYDFEDLLRERREKVFTEYRATTHDVSLSPVPPPRRFANGSIQLPSTLPTSTSRRPRSPQLSARSQSQSRNYNYDFEFNLNLDDVDGKLWTQRSRTLERSPQRPLQKLKQQQQQQYQQQHQQLYETRDIPLTSTYVEHNYHTISSSSPTNATTMKSNNNNNNINHISRENAMFDIYATPYDKRKRVMEPLEALATATATAAGTSASTLRSKRSDYSATYGNDHLYGHEQHSNIGQMTDRASSPIYATSTKKVNAAALSTLPSSVTFANSVGGNGGGSANSSTSSNNVASALTITDYPTTTTTTSTMIRPETPAFPVTPRTPYAPKANGYPQRTQQHTLTELHNYSAETIYGNNYRPRLNSTISMANSEPQEVAAHLVKFAKDSSKFWYKPNLSREEAISLLVNASPGTFVVRDSTTYKNAYGLVLRVAQPPPGTTSTGKPDELVRHFLIEPTTRGVRLKGCANEPVFTSLSALVYEHSTNQLALPCLLNIPDRDLVPPLIEPTAAQKQLMTQGAACNVLWLFSCDTESLTGEEAIRKAIRQMYAQTQSPAPTEVHFKVTQQGITLTDNTRKKFFRKHYTAETISYCAIDPDHRLWTMQEHGNDNTTVLGALKKTIFAFVARCSPSSKDNQCHVFCDLAINQPASAIVSFVNKTLPTEKQKNYVL